MNYDKLFTHLQPIVEAYDNLSIASDDVIAVECNEHTAKFSYLLNMWLYGDDDIDYNQIEEIYLPVGDSFRFLSVSFFKGLTQ